MSEAIKLDKDVFSYEILFTNSVIQIASSLSIPEIVKRLNSSKKDLVCFCDDLIINKKNLHTIKKMDTIIHVRKIEKE